MENCLTPSNQRVGRPAIKGSVMSVDMEVISDANITNLTTGHNFRSDEDGRFSIPAAPGDDLRFSHAAYEPLEIKASQFNGSYVQLQPFMLDEVTVPGYTGNDAKKTDRTLWYVFGALAAIYAYKKLSVKKVTV